MASASPAITVEEPTTRRSGRYRGERSFPLIIQNVHRYFLYLALIFLDLLTHDVWKAPWFTDPATDVVPGMVVLDAVHRIQATQAGDLAVRWNCKAGKCGSCSAEVNGQPRLMCMTRLSELPLHSAAPGRK